eukprot:459815-Pelagomonas_calceolata.AAC.2
MRAHVHFMRTRTWLMHGCSEEAPLPGQPHSKQLLKYDRAKLGEENKKDNAFITVRAMLASRLFQAHMYPVIGKGLKNKLVQDELTMPGDQACETSFERFEDLAKSWVQQHSVALQEQQARGCCEENKLDALFDSMLGGHRLAHAPVACRLPLSLCTIVCYIPNLYCVPVHLEQGCLKQQAQRHAQPGGTSPIIGLPNVQVCLAMCLSLVCCRRRGPMSATASVPRGKSPTCVVRYGKRLGWRSCGGACGRWAGPSSSS